MASLTTILEIAVGIAMTGGLVWAARRRPTPVRIRARRTGRP